jgi:hypothetical protein
MGIFLSNRVAKNVPRSLPRVVKTLQACVSSCYTKTRSSFVQCLSKYKWRTQCSVCAWTWLLYYRYRMMMMCLWRPSLLRTLQLPVICSRLPSRSPRELGSRYNTSRSKSVGVRVLYVAWPLKIALLLGWWKMAIRRAGEIFWPFDN